MTAFVDRIKPRPLPGWGGRGAGTHGSPLLEEGAAGVLHVLELQEAGSDQQTLDVLLVDGHVAVVRKVYQRL